MKIIILSIAIATSIVAINIIPLPSILIDSSGDKLSTSSQLISDRSDSSLNSKITTFAFPRRGSPRNRSDAVVRGDIFTALVPLHETIIGEKEKGYKFGLTHTEHPTFWLYFEDPSQATIEKTVNVRFTLSERNSSENNDIRENSKIIYQTKFKLTGGAGIFHFQIPQDAPPLQIGKFYDWQFEILHSGDRYTWLAEEGAIERIPMPANLANELEKASPVGRIILYGDNGIWYEMLTELAELRLLNPNNSELGEIWSAMLDRPDINQKNLQDKPFTDCCN